jgi:hypothetical protein
VEKSAGTARSGETLCVCLGGGGGGGGGGNVTGQMFCNKKGFFSSYFRVSCSRNLIICVTIIAAGVNN